MHFLEFLAEQRIADAERDGLLLLRLQLEAVAPARAALFLRGAYRDRLVAHFAGRHSTED
jgi:hypothetical protein